MPNAYLEDDGYPVPGPLNLSIHGGALATQSGLLAMRTGPDEYTAHPTTSSSTARRF